MNQRDESADSRLPSQATRSLLSIAIFCHLFAVVVVLFANHYGSILLYRLTGTLAPYTRTLYLDPNFLAAYHLTHAMQAEDDHVIEIRGEAEPATATRRYPQAPSTGVRWGFRHQRWKRLAIRLSGLAADEQDEIVAHFARAIGETVLAEGSERIELRCLRFDPLPLDPEVQGTGAALDAAEAVYVARVWKDERGVVRVHKEVAQSEAAPVRPPSDATPGDESF